MIEAKALLIVAGPLHSSGCNRKRVCLCCFFLNTFSKKRSSTAELRCWFSWLLDEKGKSFICLLSLLSAVLGEGLWTRQLGWFSQGASHRGIPSEGWGGLQCAFYPARMLECFGLAEKNDTGVEAVSHWDSGLVV